MHGGWTIWVVFTSCVIKPIKDKSEQPKEGNWIKGATTGLPNGINSYGNRTIIVPSILTNKPHQGRIVVNVVLSNRNYSTGSATTPKSM